MSVHFSSKRQNWKTPKAFYEKLDAEFHFDFDPCPPDPTFDGLTVAWGQRNFVNPEYKYIKYWVEKAYTEWQKQKLVVMLIPSRTDTKVFHDYFWDSNKHQPYWKIEIRFIKGRLKFDEHKNSAPFPSMLVVMR